MKPSARSLLRAPAPPCSWVKRLPRSHASSMNPRC